MDNKIYRFKIDGRLDSKSYSLAEFWKLYRATFIPSWNRDGVLTIQDKPHTVTLISPWSELVIYPLPDAIGRTTRALLSVSLICYLCQHWKPRDGVSSAQIDGVDRECCEECLAECPTCGRCDNHCSEVYDIDGEDWCEDCRDSHATRCEDCRDWYPDTATCDGLSHRNNWYCESCSQSYQTCESCGDLLSEGNQYYREGTGNTYCSDCLPSDEDDDDNDNASRSIHDYSYKPDTIFHGSSKHVHYGVELEVTCPRDTADDTLDVLGGESHVYLKDDSSIVDKGYEIVTHPHTLSAHRELWDGFNDYARKRGFKANGNGMHVHIERAKLTPYRIAIMQRFLNRADNRALVTAIAQRDCSSWAILKPELAAKMCCGDGTRYSALNLCNRATVEIRIFRGTIRKSEFLKNLEFCDALVSWSVDRSHAETSAGDFLPFVRANRKRYPALDKFLTDAGYLPAIKTDTRSKENTPVCA